MTLAILGVTGYTGRLVLAEARRAGLPVRLVGRRQDALNALAQPGEEVRVADARSLGTLREAFAGVSVVASCAGPFLELGLAPVEAAIAERAHYLDTTGEQAFVRLVHDRLAEPAAAAGVVAIPAFGFDYVPGDLAARLAAEQVEGPLDEIVVAYSVRGVDTSRGTRSTIAALMSQELVAWEDGRLVPSRFGATTRKVEFPFGEKTVVEWSGAEPITVPRHTDVRNVRSYIRAPAAVAQSGRFGKLVGPALSKVARFGRAGPSEESRRKSSFTVVAEASGAAGTGPGRADGLRPLRPDGAPARPRCAGAARGRGARQRRSRTGGGVRRSLARRAARAVPPNRGMTSGRTLTLRAVQRLRNLSEAECYARCYGWRMDDVVTVTKIEPRRPRYELSVSGELRPHVVRVEARLPRA